MLWVFDINETMLDLAPLDAVFEEAGLPGRRIDWFGLLIRTALVTTATGQYRDFGRPGRRHACRRRTAAIGCGVAVPSSAS